VGHRRPHRRRARLAADLAPVPARRPGPADRADLIDRAPIAPGRSTRAPRTFAPTTAAPLGWTTSFAPASLILAPGQTGALTMTKTAPVTTAPAPYPVDVTVDGVTATASVTTTAARTRVTTSVPGGPFVKNVALTVRAAVTYGAGPAPAGAPVTFVIKRPDLVTTTVAATTGAGGLATASYAPPKAGGYTVSALAYYPANTTATSAQVAFTVGN